MPTDSIPWTLVTGAAGAIGSAVVRTYVEAGLPVIGLDRNPAVRSLAGPDRYRGFQVDLQDEGQLDDVMKRIDGIGPIRHLVGIAGGALPEEPGSQDDPVLIATDAFRASIEANLVTQFAVLRAILPRLRQEGHDDGVETGASADRSITLTSSWNALTGCGMPAYSAAKAGLIGMMRSLTGPLGAEGIRINVVAPGTVDTPRTRGLWAHEPGHFEQLEAETALGRLPSPDEVAQVFFFSARMTAVTGQVLVVDSGQLIKRPGNPRQTSVGRSLEPRRGIRRV